MDILKINFQTLIASYKFETEIKYFKTFSFLLAQLAEAVEYTDCISVEE